MALLQSQDCPWTRVSENTPRALLGACGIPAFAFPGQCLSREQKLTGEDAFQSVVPYFSAVLLARLEFRITIQDTL